LRISQYVRNRDEELGLKAGVLQKFRNPFSPIEAR